MLDSQRCVLRKPVASSMNFARPLALVATILLAACGTGNGEDSSDPSGLGSRAATSANLTTQTCPAATISGSTCSGPWDYQQYVHPCYAEKAAAPCPTVGPSQTCYPSCMHNYLAPFNYTYTYPPVEVCKLVKVCEPCTAARPQLGGAITDAQICQPSCFFEEQCTTKCDTNNIDGLPAVGATNGWQNPTFTFVSGNICTGVFSVQQHQDSPDPSCGAGSDCSTYSACRDASFGLDPDPKACGASQAFSASGLTKDGLSLADPYAAVGDPQFATSPSCTTCEDLPVDAVDPAAAQAQAQKKAKCLLDNLANYLSPTRVPALAPNVDKVGLETALVSNLKALYERAASLLTVPQQDSILALYTSKPAEKYPCSGWTAPPLPAGCTANPQADGLMDLCARLDTVATDPGLLAKYTDQCLDNASLIAGVPTACNASAYRGDYGAATLDLMRQTQTQLQASADRTLSIPEVQKHLARIEKWYGASRVLNPGTPPTAAVAAGTSTVLGSFWKAVDDAIGVPAAGTKFGTLPGQTPPEVLFTLFPTSLAAHRAVLAAALTDAGTQPPLTSAPLVELLGDSLEAMSDRLDQVGRYQDLGCRFRLDGGAATPSCRSLRTEIGELTRFLSTLHDPAALSKLLADPNDARARFSSPTWTDWHTIFEDWSTRSSVVSAAVDDALGAAAYTPDLLLPSGVAQVPANAFTSGLATIIRHARTRISSYDATGLMDSSSIGVLRAGVQKSRVDDLVLRVQQQIANLNTQLTNYNTDRIKQAESLTAEMNNTSQQQNIANQIAARERQDNDLMADVAGLRASIEEEESRFGDFLAAYDNLLKFNTDPRTQISHQPIPVDVVPNDAHWLTANTVMSPGTPLGSFVQGAAPIVTVHAGDLLHITTSRTWAPTCALSNSPFADLRPPDAIPAIIDQRSLDTVQTGPEGFLLQLGTSGFNAVSNSSVKETAGYNTTSTTNKLCAGFDGGPDISFTTLANETHEEDAHAEFCTIHDSGTNSRDATADTSSNGSESRYSANFTTGLRLTNTPFPAFPAGSLLLVQVKKGGKTRADVVDIQVLQSPSSGIVIGNYTDPSAPGTAPVVDFDIYLAVNDLSCAAAAGKQGLHLDIVWTQPVISADPTVPSISEQLGKGMGVALDHLRSQMPALLEQGRIGPEQMSSLRAQAYEDLRAACGQTNCALSFYPPEMQTFFGAWISKELATLERKADLRSDQRQLAVRALEAKQLADDLANAQTSARLLQLVPTWRLEDVSSHVLEDETESLLDLMVGEVYPIIDLLDPETVARCPPGMTTCAQLVTTSLDRLVGAGPLAPLDWTGDLSDWSQTAVLATTDVVNQLQSVSGDKVPAVDTFLVLGYPDPQMPPPSAGSWRRASPERAKAVWDAIRDPAQQFFSVQVLPSDLWSATGGNDVLLCSSVAPVITAFELYMARPVGMDDYPTLTIPMQIDGNLEFPSAGQDKWYRLVNPTWLQQGIGVQGSSALTTDAVLFQDLTKKLGDNAPTPYKVANGLSPFTKFDIGTDGLRLPPLGGAAPIEGATELLLVFRVQAQGGALHLAPMCP